MFVQLFRHITSEREAFSEGLMDCGKEILVIFQRSGSPNRERAAYCLVSAIG